MSKPDQQSTELSSLERSVLKLIEEAPRQYRNIHETLKANESEVARTLSRLAMLGLVHKAGPWYRAGAGNPGAPRTRSPRREPRGDAATRPLAYLLVDLLGSDGLGADEEQAILTLVRWLKRSGRPSFVFPPSPRETPPQPQSS